MVLGPLLLRVSDMAESPLNQTERLMRLMGEAFVTWSEIESLWRRMFPFLLFRDFKHPRDEAWRAVGGRADDELSVAEERAYALWDSLLSSKAQLDLILDLAPLVLINPDQGAGLAQLLSVGNATNTKRGKRNALAHSGFERFTPIESTFDSGFIVAGKEVLQAARHAHTEIRGKDLAIVIPQFLEEFRQHREEVRNVWSWLIVGTPKDAGAPSPDKDRKRSKAPAPTQEERDHLRRLKKRPPRPGSSQE